MAAGALHNRRQNTLSSDDVIYNNDYTDCINKST